MAAIDQDAALGRQIVEDAKRHGVEVRPVDALRSDWDCTLEEGAVRLGLRMARGLAQAAGARIVAVQDHTGTVARPSGLDLSALQAQVDALPLP